MKTIIIATMAFILIGCANPYKAAYERGEITAAQYYQLELANRQAVSQALMQGGAYLQNQQAINNMNRPQNVYVWPMR